MAIAAGSSIPLEGIDCSTSTAVNSHWIKSPIDCLRTPNLTIMSHKCWNTFFGATNMFNRLSKGRDICLSRVSVAADYSDSVPDSSSNYMGKQGYHPLEDIKISRRIRHTKLTSAEIARTTVEANCSALLVFPGGVHSEPHERRSWAEYQYIIDDYGDIFFEIFDDENILQDRGASNPVNALFEIDMATYEERRIVSEFNIPESGDDISFDDDDYFEVTESELSDISVDWGMPDNSKWVHPIYFSKCMNAAINVDFGKIMEYPSNGVSIIGCLRPAAFIDEESYLRNIFQSEEGNGYISDSTDARFSWRGNGKNISSTLYRLEIMRIELFSVYGVESRISMQDFKDAEADVLLHSSTLEILEHFTEENGGVRLNVALKALCKKKGLGHVERANLIGIDSLGMDVRTTTSSGAQQVQTYRFPFKTRATCEATAKKQIQQLLFPRSQRKKLKDLSHEYD